MSAWWPAAVVLGTTLSGLVGHWLRLRFLQRVYERGGAEDLKVAAEALREVRGWNPAEEIAGRRLGRRPGPSTRRDP